MGPTLSTTSVKALILRRKGKQDSTGQEVVVQRVEEVVFNGRDKEKLLRWVDKMISL
jgi:hypothetical protein